MLGQVSRRQSGYSVLLNQLLQERRHAGGRRRHSCRGPIQCRAFSGALALSVLVFIQGKEPTEDGAGFGISQVDMAQIPESRTHTEPLEMVVAGGDLKTDTLQTDGAVGAALGAIRFGREGHLKFGAGWTGPPDVAVVEVTLQRQPWPSCWLVRWRRNSRPPRYRCPAPRHWKPCAPCTSVTSESVHRSDAE